MTPSLRAFLAASAVALTLTLSACSAGSSLTSTPSPIPQGTPPGLTTPLPEGIPPDFAVLWEAYKHLRQDSVHRNELDNEALAHGAVRGMLLALDDPYASFLDPSSRLIQQDDYTGSFAGIGADVALRDGILTIVSPMEGSPAEQAGLRAGDSVLSVDGKSLSGLTFLEQVARVRGPAGTPVTLGILKPGAAQMVEITVVRQTIAIPSVAWKQLPDGLALLRITRFIRTTDSDVASALREVKASGARGVVLDLRNNPGGFLDTTVNVASQFLRDGLVLYEIDGAGQRTDWKVAPGGELPDLPMVVLVNEGSASGAEVLSGALQARGRARLIGTKTFGKGSVNITRDLSDGSAIIFTIARWYLPNGHLIEGQGLTPDVVVEPKLGTTSDTQMDTAVRTLQDVISGKTPATFQPPPTSTGT